MDPMSSGEGRVEGGSPGRVTAAAVWSRRWTQIRIERRTPCPAETAVGTGDLARRRGDRGGLKSERSTPCPAENDGRGRFATAGLCLFFIVVPTTENIDDGAHAQR